MAVIIGIIALKGGVGKSTLARALAREFVADGMTAKIADPSAYRQNNMDYPPAASRIGVQVATRPSGVPYLRISSSQSMATSSAER